MRYEITSLDTSADGMERLRNQDEFILIAYGDATTSDAELLADWKQDVQSCARPDDFDWDAIDSALDAYVADNGKLLNAVRTEVGRSPKLGMEAALAELENIDFSAFPGLYDAIPWERMEEIAGDDELGSAPFRLYVRDLKGGDA